MQSQQCKNQQFPFNRKSWDGPQNTGLRGKTTERTMRK